MKFKLFLVLLFGTLVSMQGQNSVKPALLESQGTISGKIIDKNSNQPLPYVNIIVKEGTKFITGDISSDKGTFLIKNLPLKTYTVEIQFMGYKTVTKKVSLSNENKNGNLNTIVLEEDAIQLKGVEIISEKSTFEQKIDRKVINVGKDIVASGTNASEIFNNIPTVSIDPQTKELSLRGNNNVRVLIDGKPSNIDTAQLLQQIPSSSIKQIELITNPSAKYNPEGMSGIINIILHKNAKDGFNGSINSGVTFGITPKLNTALNLNYKTGKINIYGNYGLNHGRNANRGFINSERPNLENEQNFNFINLNTSHLLKAGIDYYINEKNTLSFYTNQNIVDGKGNGSTFVNYIDPSNDDTKQLFNSKSDNNTQTYDIDYKHEFTKKGENIEAQANFSKTKNNENTLYQFPFIPTSNTNNIDSNTDNYQINIDYVNPLSETAKLELGAESRNLSTSNQFLDYITATPNTTNHFSYDRNIYSAYANYSKQWKKWSGQVGLRLENYSIEAAFNSKVVNPSFTSDKNIEDNIFSFYPSAFFTYTLDDKNTFNLNYSRRVDRPSVGQINPIREWTTPLVESRGNPELEPQFTNSFEVNYTKTTKIGSITSGIFYRQINNEIGRVIYKNPDNSNQDIISFNNFDNNNSYGIESSANLKFTPWWSINASVDAYFKTVKGTVENANTGLLENGQVDVTTFNARLNNTFTATKELRFQLFGMYRGRDLGLQFERNAMYKADLGATYNVLKGKGTITVRANDLFNTMHFGFNGKIPYNQVGAFYWESQTYYIGFNYIFGGAKNKALQRKQRDANETQGGGGIL
ncbi:outer membrane beta-barrel family protein [Flavobacterium sp. K5-23]|uniref:outer membrane beta-barrel family protein n=1 Tax=Flavobacterium sp. K5-23 TaxID=2746225 RepID=UPI00200CBCF7|nr:outer membrane beta-barrel family protein [Flavobacterium sp. K5-23]UQD56207.1 TonB-dependent receptor [Flavobacterium sp. K5-23]